MKKSSSSLFNALADVMRSVYRTHEGVLIEKVPEGYKALRTVYPTYEDAVYGIDKFKKEFNELAAKQNPHICKPQKES
jgi:hypothetical protein